MHILDGKTPNLLALPTQLFAIADKKTTGIPNTLPWEGAGNINFGRKSRFPITSVCIHT
jgi:hypothetical protein